MSGYNIILMESWEEKIEIVKAIKYHLFEGSKLKPCMWCTMPLELDEATLEHIQPKSHGGPLTVNNAGIACNSCNQKRGTKSPDEFISSAWLLEKRRQMNSQKKNRKIPCHSDGFPMSDAEIRLASSLYLNTLTKNELVATITGIAKQNHLDRWAALFQELNK